MKKLWPSFEPTKLTMSVTTSTIKQQLSLLDKRSWATLSSLFQTTLIKRLSIEQNGLRRTLGTTP